MYRIKTYNNIAEVGLALLTDRALFSEVADGVKEPHGMVLRSHKLAVEEFGSQLLAVARAGAGVNNIPVEDCTKKGIAVFNTPGANANAVKELVIAGLFMSSRRINEGAMAVNNMSDKSDAEKKAEKLKAEFAGPEILGKTLGIIGLGAIGSLVVQAAISLGMKVVGFDPYLSVQNAWRIPNQAELAHSMDALLAKSDYISLHVPAVADTKGLVNAAFLAKCKPGVRIINFARGEIVDVPAMLSALESGQAAYHVTDFADEKMIGKKGVLTLPHLGASTPEAEDNCAVMACEEIRDYLLHGNIVNSVNLPALSLGEKKTGSWRIALIHLNQPKMINQFTDLIGDEGLNIDNMINSSRGETAATMFDVNNKPAESLISKMKAIDGVLRLRTI